MFEGNKVEVAEKSGFPKELMKAKRSEEEMTAHWMKLESANQNQNEFYGLRWETIGKRRFYEAPEVPVKPSALKLFKFIR